MKALNLIGGRWQPALSGETHASIDPATGEEIGRVVSSGRADAEAAVAAAAGAFENPQWSQNPRLRQIVLLRWADRLEEIGETDDEARDKAVTEALLIVGGAAPESWREIYEREGP